MFVHSLNSFSLSVTPSGFMAGHCPLPSSYGPWAAISLQSTRKTSSLMNNRLFFIVRSGAGGGGGLCSLLFRERSSRSRTARSLNMLGVCLFGRGARLPLARSSPAARPFLASRSREPEGAARGPDRAAAASNGSIDRRPAKLSRRRRLCVCPVNTVITGWLSGTGAAAGSPGLPGGDSELGRRGVSSRASVSRLAARLSAGV